MKMIERIVSTFAERVLKDIEDISSTVEIDDFASVIEQAAITTRNKEKQSLMGKKLMMLSIVNSFFK